MRRINLILKNLGTINERPNLIRARNALAIPVARFLIRLGFRPTGLNLIGLVLGIIGSALAAFGNFSGALLVLLLSGLADALDGSVARELGIDSQFGAFLDSVLDRYVDSAIFVGIALYYAGLNENVMVLGTLLALVGASVTSYTAARAGSLGVHRYIGFLGRPERVILLLLGIAFPSILPAVVWILAFLGNLTAIHRTIFYLLSLRGSQTTDQRDE